MMKCLGTDFLACTMGVRHSQYSLVAEPCCEVRNDGPHDSTLADSWTAFDAAALTHRIR